MNQFLAGTENQPSQATKALLGKTYNNLAEVCGVLGIYSEKQDSASENVALFNQLLDLIIDLRQDARNRKDWETADKIRDRLKQLDIELKDSRHSTTWKIGN